MPAMGAVVVAGALAFVAWYGEGGAQTVSATVRDSLAGARAELEHWRAAGNAAPPMTEHSPPGPLCRAADPAGFFAHIDRHHDLSAAALPDIAALEADVLARRHADGFFSAAGIENAPPKDRALLVAAAADMALGGWTLEHGPARAGERDGAGGYAVVQRAWCNLGRRNEAVLETYLDTHGVPDSRAASSAALLLAKHARPDASVITRFTAMTQAAYEAGEASGVDYALLMDALAIHRGEPQPFGTYMRCGENGVAEFTGGVADPEHLEARRAEYGLFPLEFQREQVEAQCRRLGD